jgi:hypothetical protein
MECPARMIGEPFEDVGLFVGGIVVDDGVDDFSGRHGALDGVEEANELLVAMPSHAASDHGSVEDVERCKQSGRAVAVVFGIRLPRADAWDCHEPAARSAIDRYLNFAYSEILACAVEMRRVVCLASDPAAERNIGPPGPAGDLTHFYFGSVVLRYLRN